MADEVLSDLPTVVEHKVGVAVKGPMTTEEAARSVIDWRRKKQAEDGAEPATSAPKSVEPDVTPAPQPSDSTDGNLEPEEALPIEPPRSWTKDEKERFQSLPRETQEYIASRETERDRELRRVQNEAAETRKTLDADRLSVDEAKHRYETALPTILTYLSDAYNAEFADIKTAEDIANLAKTNPLRYFQYDAQQKQLGIIYHEIEQNLKRNHDERNRKLATFQHDESKKFAAKVPEISDPEKRRVLMDSAEATLREVGFNDDEMGKLWSGEDRVSIHDHRFQLLVHDAARYREAKARVKDINGKARPIPPVQRPGAALNREAAAEASLKDLEGSISKLPSQQAMRAAAKLVVARRQNRS